MSDIKITQHNKMLTGMIEKRFQHLHDQMHTMMRRTLATSVIVSMLVVSTAAFAILYFERAAEVRRLSQMLESQALSTLAPGSITAVPLSMPPETAHKVGLATVRIDVIAGSFTAVGSGLVVANNGYVLTNQHVIEDARSITITLTNGDTFPGKLVGFNAERDLALIKLETDRSNLQVITLAASSDAGSGTPVMAVGYPMGLHLFGPPSFTAGVVSAVRDINGLKYIQTDAALKSGSGGGPLVNYQGDAVGVCSGMIVEDNVASPSMGLAIPIADCIEFLRGSDIGYSG